MIELSIILPCLNESKTLGTCINWAREFIDNTNISSEIIVADNGSTDNSTQIARDLGANVISVPLRGYGAALKAGCNAAKGKYIVMADSDESYDLKALAPYINQLDKGHDFVMGNRFLGGIEKGAMPWKNRYIGNPLLSSLARYKFKSQLGDFFCGQRAITKEAYQRLNLQANGMEFAFEMIFRAIDLKMKIAEIPIKLYSDGRDDKPRLRPWKDGFRTLKFISDY